MSRSHKSIDSQSTFHSVFPEEMPSVKESRKRGDIDSYRASWEPADYMPRHGRINTDDSALYEGEEV